MLRLCLLRILLGRAGAVEHGRSAPWDHRGAVPARFQHASAAGIPYRQSALLCHDHGLDPGRISEKISGGPEKSLVGPGCGLFYLPLTLDDPPWPK